MVSMKLEGAAQLAERLSALSPGRQRGLLHKMLREAGEPMRQRMSQIAPDDPESPSPDLKTQIVISIVRGKEVSDTEVISRLREDSEAIVAVGPSKAVPQGILQEFGTVHHGAQPFVRPAYDAGVAGVVTRLQHAIWAYLRGKARGVMSPSGRGL
jgi:HK97 gp10 family phage protein